MHASSPFVVHFVALAFLALLAGGCSPEAKKARLVEKADRHYAAGDYDSAEVEYLNLMRLDPQNGHPIGRLGLIYTAQGRTGRAIAYLTRGRELSPNDLDLRLRMGQLHLASGKPAEARAEAEHILGLQPQDPEAPLLFAATLTNPAEAESLRQRLLSLPAPVPAGSPVLTALASLELRLGRAAEAESLIQQAKTADPAFAGLYSVLAAIHLSKRDLAGAEEAFRQAAVLSPPRSPRQLQYAQFKIRSGDPETGAKLLQEITTKTPDYVPAWIALAEVNLAQNKLDEAGELLARALGRDPQNLEAMLLQGRLFILKGEPAKAVTHFERLVESYPRAPIIHQELGRAYAGTGDLTKAINSLNQALVLAPNSTEIPLLLAQLNSRKGDHNAAIVLLRRTVEQRPTNAQARLMLADAYRIQGNLDAALIIYQDLGRQTPDNPQIQMLSGLVHAQLGRNSDARQAFETAFKLTPDSPAALEQLVNLGLREKEYDTTTTRVQTEMTKNPKLAGFGQLLLAKISLARENHKAAEQHLKNAVELMPDSPTAYFLLAGIYSRTNRQEEALSQLNEVLARNPQQTTALMLASVIQDQRGNYDRAREGYEKLLALNPRSVVALNNLAYLHAERLNELDKAQELAQRARQLAPSDPHNADTLGWILHRKRQYPWALSLLQESAEKLPGEAEIQFHLGLTHYMMGDELAARAALERSLQNSPTASWVATARQALDLLNIPAAQITAAAKPTLDKALAERPDDPIALLRLAALHERDGKVDLATSVLEPALKVNAHNVNILLTLARLHDQADHSAKALEYAKEARKLAPDDPAVAQSLGRLAYDNGDYPWAASLLQEAARRRQDSADLHFDLARASYSVGRVAEAQSALRSALDLAGSQNLFTRVAEARQMLELIALAENPTEAVRQSAQVEAALKTDPSSVPALMASGAISEQKLDSGAARQTYEKVLARFPDFVPAKHRLVVLGASLKTFDQKVHDWALQIRPSYAADALVAKTLGIQTYLRGDSTRAAALLRESVTGRSNDAEVHYFLGLAQHQLKDAAYKASLQRALELGLQDSSATDQTRKLLAEAK